KLAGRVLTGFPDTFDGAKEELVGNPVRAEIAAIPPPAQRFADRGDALRVLVLGGSQGARALNEAVPAAIAALRKPIRTEVRHQCGERAVDAAKLAYAQAGVTASI